MHEYDDRARKILLKAYWSAAGWKDRPDITPEDFAYARAAGYMFDPVTWTHDKIVQAVRQTSRSASKTAVCDAFLASLSTRRLELRSALGSYAVARHFPQHTLRRRQRCAICGVGNGGAETHDLSVLNFERYKWGGVRHLDPAYIAFDLDQFSTLELVTPREEDIAIMRRICEIARTLEPGARPRHLERHLIQVFPSNAAEREVLIQILGYCGILQPAGHTGFFETFTRDTDRSAPYDTEWNYPVSWWTGRDGVNAAALEDYFPQLQAVG
jgi:hypothetical protein